MVTGAKEFDAIVFGDGMAGFAAALNLKRRRKNVCVVTKNPGATALSSGAFDFGPIASAETSFAEARASWNRALDNILVDRPGLLSPEFVRPMISEITEPLRLSLPIEFRFDRPYVLPTSQGNWKMTFGAQKIHIGAELGLLKNRRVGLVTSEHWRFRADLVAQRLSLQAKVEPLLIDLKLKGTDWPLPRVAAALSSQTSLQEDLLKATRARLEAGRFDVLLFPPLFASHSIAEKLEQALRVPIVETLNGGEPIAGQRLWNAMQATFRRLQIPTVNASEFQPVVAADTVKSIKLKTSPAEWQELRAKNYVLASGKFFGGGIELGYPNIRETLFDLPVFHSRHREQIKVRSQIPWEDRAFLEEQPWARLGVWVDKQWRPTGTDGKPVFNNLFACGSVIGGADFAKEGLGLGFMAYTGKGCTDEVE